ncbi:hypothetical protein ROLI_047520 (plasmid) [Roseobacter fucihabitans]|uniref:MoaF-like domain-containing protein n=1 Tax=Roseobacter fucihabitans TaxID=1537242 RepID=A0ABZ2BZP2_9RHOB|nr:MoaF C-terminal domain-containing protein [Roseobacter litoralis]MBC6968295.1 Molybdenum cofactor biosynthesis protein F [Roseobacter litoralis]
MGHKDIIGMSFGFVYSDETYGIEVLSQTALRWTRTAGKNTGQGDTEQYVFSKLTDDMFMLTWVEADGPGLSNILRLTDGTLITHANIGRDVFINPGKLTVTQ